MSRRWITHELIDVQTAHELAEIATLLEEAYEHYFKYGDGHCKSSEGAINVQIPAYFWHNDPEEDGIKRPEISVYSYVLGPSRQHYFDNATEALEEVRAWHAEEMNHDYSEDG